jgi:sec-independent protein translocase protein TatA
MNLLQPWHVVIIALVALLVFGPKKLPELARGIGEAMKEFKKTMHSVDEPEPVAPVIANTSAAPQVSEVKAPVEAASNAGGPPQT